MKRNDPIGESPEARRHLAESVTKMWMTQKRYGSEGTEMRYVIEGFLEVLEGYGFVQVMDAMLRYRQEEEDFPAPASIVKRIRPMREIPGTEEYEKEVMAMHDAGWEDDPNVRMPFKQILSVTEWP